MNKIRIRFDGPPGPEAGRFVEVEDEQGRGIRVGEWREDPSTPGHWFLEIPNPKQEIEALRDLSETAWGIIANAGYGDWTKESAMWQEAAAQWRAAYFKLVLDAVRKEAEDATLHLPTPRS